EEVQEHAAHPARLAERETAALVGIGEVHAMVFGQHLGVHVEIGEQAGRSVRRKVEGDAARLGARQEQQLVNRPVNRRQLLEQRLHSLFILVTESAGREQLFGVQSDK